MRLWFEERVLEYRLAFAEADWEPALEGTARVKRLVRAGKVFRLVELTGATEHPGWCEVGHVGQIVEGEIEIDFNGEKTVFRSGDALCIPTGAARRHRPRAVSARAVMFLIEDESDV